MSSSSRNAERMSREDFRRWVMTQRAGRFERIDGIVVAMAPERLGHADRKALIWLALRRAIIAAELKCHVYPDGVTVEAGDSDFEPDAVLRCGEKLPPDATVVPDPMVVVEVLSPGTRSDDLTRKLVGYFIAPTIQHYLILYADKPQIIHHRRDRHEIATRIVAAGAITLDPPGITITVDEVYADLV